MNMLENVENESGTIQFIWFYFFVSISASAHPRSNVRKRRGTTGYFGTGDSVWKALGFGCHLLHGPGFPLARLRGTCLARLIPNALVKIDSLIFILGILLIVPLFLPILAAYLIDFAFVRQNAVRLHLILPRQKRKCMVGCERSEVWFFNDLLKLN